MTDQCEQEQSLASKICNRFEAIKQHIGDDDDRLTAIPKEGWPAKSLKIWMGQCKPKVTAVAMSAGLGVSATSVSIWYNRGIIAKRTVLAITEWARNKGLPLLPWEKSRPETEYEKMCLKLLKEQILKEGGNA